MADDLVFFTNPMSRGRIIRWMLEEVGASYETEVLDYESSMKAPAYLAINPMGKVPAIKHGDTVVTECAAICAYLADAFPEKNLAPPTSHKDRGPYYRWLFFAAGPLEAAVTNKAMGFEVPQDKQAMAGYGNIAHVLDNIEGWVKEREFVAGNRFSAADVYLGSHLGWGMQFGTIDKRPAYERYCGKLFARPAAIKAREIDDALTPKKN